jgi:Flp pilus assembly protein TadG
MMRMPYIRFGRAHPDAGARDVRRRRGAVLVMTAAAMAGLMVVTAFAVDLSRLYVLRTELQTAADAAALAAAMRLNEGEDRMQAEPSARGAVHANPSLAGAVDIDVVRIGVWDPVARAFSGGASLDTADAVQVAVGRTTDYLFARFFTDGPIRLTARATAWAGAPAMRACVPPFFILHHDYMAALGKAHEDTLTYQDVRSLRNPAKKRWITVRLNRDSIPTPDPGWFYGMILPAVNSGLPLESGPQAYRRHIRECTVMKRKWVAKTETLSTMKSQTWPGLKELCNNPSGGECRNASGGIGVPVTVSIFCKGPEHRPPTMWFEVEWMTGLVITDFRNTSRHTEITGYLTAARGTGEIGEEKETTGIVRTILVE